MEVREVLKVKDSALFTAHPNTLLSEAVIMMAENDIGAVVVMEAGKLVGMLTFREVLRILAQRQTERRVGPTPPIAEILVGALLASLALFIMPNSPALWVAAGTLWLMDASLNVTMEPFRAFVGDNLPDRQRTMGYAMQSFFIGAGAVIAGALPWVMTNWLGLSNVAPEGQIPQTVHWAFYLGGAALLAAVA